MKVFKKGEIVHINTFHSTIMYLPIPKIGKIAASEKRKDEYLSEFSVFERLHSPENFQLIQVPDLVIEVEDLKYLKEIKNFRDTYQESELKLMFLFERKIVIPVFKEALSKPTKIKEAHKNWEYLRKYGKSKYDYY